MQSFNGVNIKSRIISLLIDYAVIILGILIMGSIQEIILGIYLGIAETMGNYAGINSVQEKTIDNVALGLIILLILFYYGHTFKKEGQTIGEKTMKIKVVPAYGKRINLLPGIVRTFFLAPLLALIGMFYVSKESRRTILDHICLTNTVKVE